MRKHRVIATIVAVASVIGCLTGCGSEASKKYLGIVTEMQGYGGIDAQGEVNISFDADEFTKISEGGNLDVEVPNNVANALKNGVSIKYGIKSDAPNGTNADVNATLGVNGKQYKAEARVRKDGMFISSDTMTDIVALSYELGVNKDGKIALDSYKKAVHGLKDAGYDWIKVSGEYEEVDLSGIDIKETFKMDYTKIAEIFKNVTASDIISLDKDTVKIDCNGTRALELLKRVAEDMINNPDSKAEFFNSLGIEGVNTEQLKETVVQSGTSLLGTVQLLQTDDGSKEFKEIKSLLDNSKYTAEISCGNDTVKSSSELIIAVESGKNIVKIAGKQDLSELKGAYDGEAITKYIGIDDFDSKVLLNNRDYAPVSTCEISWATDDSSFVKLIDANGSNIYTYVSNMEMRDDRIYLPLRRISETCGLQVDWEDNKAYVTDRSGNKVDMSSIIVNDRTYVKVRDFEKLGVKVDYTTGDFGSRATLTF